MKTQPYMRPLRQPFEEVYVSYKDGDVFIYKPRQYCPDKLTRLCLPADYKADKLTHFNQLNSKQLAVPWSPLHILKEDFDVADTDAETDLWSASIQGNGQQDINVTAIGKLYQKCEGDGVTGVVVEVNSKRDFTGDFDLEAKVNIPNYGTATRVYLWIYKDSNNFVRIGNKGAKWICEFKFNGAYVVDKVGTTGTTTPTFKITRRGTCWKAFYNGSLKGEYDDTNNYMGDNVKVRLSSHDYTTGALHVSEWDYVNLRLIKGFNVGTTLINFGANVFIHDRDYIGALTQYHPEIILDKANKKFSFEFYINNNLKDVSDVQINSCDSLVNWSGSANVTLSIDTIDFKEGSGSLQIVATVGAGGGYESAEYNPPGTMDLTDKEFLKVFVKSDDVTDVRIYIDLWSATGYFSRWLITPSTINTWERDPWVLPLRKPDEIGYNGEVDLSAVDRISIYIFNDSGASKTITVKVDDISKDVGQWVKVEVYVPDLPLADAGDGWSTRIFSWDILTGAWKTTPFIKWAIDGGSAVYGTTWLMFLDGTDDSQIWDDIKKGVSAFDVGERGDMKSALGGGFASNITYSSYYGCKKRIGFAVKMPPDDGQDSATNGISQCKLKIELYYDDDGKTTYEFEKSTNQYYGLDNINDSWLSLFNPTANLLEYLILNQRPLGLKVVADHNEAIWAIAFTLRKGTRIWMGELVHGDHGRDTDNDGVPDIFEEDYDPSIVLDIDFNNEDETQNIVHDRSPNRNNGTIYGAEWVDGKIGRALSFVNAYVGIPDDASLNFGADESFSISAWFKLSSLPTTDLYAILSKYGAGQGAGYNDLYALYVDTAGKIRFSIRDSAGNNPVVIGSTLTIDTWYHVVGVRDTEKDEIRLYLNGVLDATPVTDTTVDDLSSPRPLLIGNQEHYIAGEAPILPFQGIIDEIHIFKGRILRTDEIQELYNLGKLKRISVPRKVKKMGYAGW